jgi:hypothetical protein
MNTADDERFLFSSNVGLHNPKKLVEGKDFSRYKINWSGKFVDYLTEKMKIKETARPGSEERFESEKVILYRFIDKNGLLKGVYDNQSYYALGSTYVLREKTDLSLKIITRSFKFKTYWLFLHKIFLWFQNY